MTTKIIIEKLKSGIKFGNQNTDFIIHNNNEFYMCEYTKDCKYTQFSSIEKLARIILKFYKIGY